MKTKAIFSILGFFLVFTLNAQFKVNNQLSNFYIDGTSSLHDWTETVETISGAINADISGQEIDKIKSLNITIPVKSIKSGKSGMDKNTYNALKEADFPNITFKLITYSIEGNKLSLKGNLTIAGITKTVRLSAIYEMVDGNIEIEGKHVMKMTDFKVDPPTAVMGTIKTGDEITLRFNLVFIK